MSKYEPPYPAGYPDDPSEEELAALPAFSLEDQLRWPEMLDQEFAHVVYTEMRKGRSVVIFRTPMDIVPTEAQYQKINHELHVQLQQNLPGLLDERIRHHAGNLLEILREHAEKAVALEVKSHRRPPSRVYTLVHLILSMAFGAWLVYAALRLP